MIVTGGWKGRQVFFTPASDKHYSHQACDFKILDICNDVGSKTQESKSSLRTTKHSERALAGRAVLPWSSGVTGGEQVPLNLL